MAEYIEREALLDSICHETCGIAFCGATNCAFMAKVCSAPAADVSPVVHGHWIKDNDSFQTDDYYCCYFDYNCSECSEIVNDRYKLPNYCPNCGAKMDGEDGEVDA